MKAMLMAVVFLSAALALAQDQEAAARFAAGCGPNPQQFEVKTDRNLHPAGQPEANKALVYVFAD